MKTFASWLMVAAIVAAGSGEAQALMNRYAVRATCARAGITGIGVDVTVAAAAENAIAECRASGARAGCCRRGVQLWMFLYH